MADEGKLIEYAAQDGSAVKLSPTIVKDYLVTGKKDLVTKEEIVYFLGECQARGMNPFKRDCYLVKYNQDPAAIIVSIHFKRSVAKAEKDCRGWWSGIIVKNGEGKIEEREGTLIFEGETLLGGWFEAQPDGWIRPIRHTVPLEPYVKKTHDGRPTRFWSKENQPYMIAKVAESQGLTRAWPVALRNLTTDEEMIDVTPQAGGDEDYPEMPTETGDPVSAEPEPEPEAKQEKPKQEAKAEPKQEPKPKPEPKDKPKEAEDLSLSMEDEKPDHAKQTKEEAERRADEFEIMLSEVKTIDELKGMHPELVKFSAMLKEYGYTDLGRTILSHFQAAKKRLGG